MRKNTTAMAADHKEEEEEEKDKISELPDCLLQHIPLILALN